MAHHFKDLHHHFRTWASLVSAFGQGSSGDNKPILDIPSKGSLTMLACMWLPEKGQCHVNRISISCNVENMRPPTFTILAGLGLALLRHPACPHGCNYPTTKNSQICHKIRFNPSPPRKKFPQRIKDNSGRRLLAHILREGGGLVTCWAKSGAEGVSLLWPGSRRRASTTTTTAATTTTTTAWAGRARPIPPQQGSPPTSIMCPWGARGGENISWPAWHSCCTE